MLMLFLNLFRKMKGTLIFSRSLQVMKPHVPLIKFRKGSQESTGDLRKTNTIHGSADKQQMYTVTTRELEDYQLPLKFRRLPLGENEIEAINTGGCN